jgi:hypothetical protein
VLPGSSVVSAAATTAAAAAAAAAAAHHSPCCLQELLSSCVPQLQLMALSSIWLIWTVTAAGTQEVQDRLLKRAENVHNGMYCLPCMQQGTARAAQHK